MIPSLAAWNGMLGLMGLRAPDASGPLADGSVASLNRGYQRQVDSCPVEYASLLRDPTTGAALGPVARLATGTTPKVQVALVGGGIGNIIAAYELSRVGIRCQVLEASGRLGGRLFSYYNQDTAQWSELGGMRFPAGGLMWHYVAQWVRSKGRRPEDVAISPFPNPGVVPTLVTYQGRTYDFDTDLLELPDIFREAKHLFTSYFATLNDGRPDPDTIYYADAVSALRVAPDDASNHVLASFWRAMLARYDGRSFGDVLQTEVFAGGSSVPDLLAAFGTLGLGTGGFGPLYEVAYLEILRLLLWDYSKEYSLPPATLFPDLYEEDSGGSQGFALALARAAVEEAGRHYKTSFSRMFRTTTKVDRIVQEADKVTVMSSGVPLTFDYAVVAMSSRAMELLGVAESYPGGPLVPSAAGTDTVRSSAQAAIKRLNMMSAYKMFATLDAPGQDPDWPTLSDNRKALCFLTDDRPRATYALSPLSADGTKADALVSYAWGSDALKFEAMGPPERRIAIADAYTSGLQSDGAGGRARTYELGQQILAASSSQDVVWNQVPFIGGGFKLDKPEDNYFADSLFYHYQIASPTWKLGEQRVFFAGDTVGHLGGWIEGAAISAVNAVVAVCARIQADHSEDLTLDARVADLLDDDVNLFHEWKYVGGGPVGLTGLVAMRRDGDWAGDPATPPSWEYEGVVTTDTYALLSVSGNGDFLVGVDRRQRPWYDRTLKGTWRQPAPLPDLPAGVSSISVATEKDDADEAAAAHLMFVLSNGGRVHFGEFRDGHWGPFSATPWLYSALKVALDVESGNSQIVVVGDGHELCHAIRFSDGAWTDLQQPASPAGPGTTFRVIDADVACGSLEADLTTVAVVDELSESVYVGVRNGKANSWTPWVEIPSPLDSRGRRLTASQVRVATVGGNNGAQVLALFGSGDPEAGGRLYVSVRNFSRDPSGQTWTAFRPAPYPLSGVAGRIAAFAPARDWRVSSPPLTTLNYAVIG